MSLNILLIGDSCTDIYTIGTTTRISPEAPVPIFEPVSSKIKPGMAANVANNLTSLGCNVEFITNSERSIKTRYIDSRFGQHLLRVDENASIEQWGGILPDLEKYDAVVISDYNKGFLSYTQIENIIRKSKGLVFIDTKKPDLERFRGAVLKINENEFNSRISQHDNLIVTFGGSHVSYKNKKYTVPKVPVFDVCGAGDTFLAALVYKYCNSLTVDDAINFAIKASAITVQHLGVYSPKLEEI